MGSKKKKVLVDSSFSRLKSGFGRNALAILSYLWKTGKYDIVEYAAGPLTWTDKRCEEVPWKCYGALPDDTSEIAHIQDQAMLRHIHYGAGNIDKVIETEKPDIYIGIEDIWAFNGYWNKPWWNKIHCVLWTTLDSLPIYPLAVDAVGKCEHFWVWASFAEKALKEHGHDHVKTVYGAVGNDNFYPLEKEKRAELRSAFGVEEDDKIFGFVFRNQLRKLVGGMLEGFSEHMKNNPNSKVLLHTHWNEPAGWDIEAFVKEFEIPVEKVLTTYICGSCKTFGISPYQGQGLPCEVCGNTHSMVTPNPALGVTDEQMNVVYNLMDAYVHPMTSGGLEMPIIEAMLAGLPVATVGYSCGEEYTNQKFVYSLGFNEYREHGSNFIKANVEPKSIKTFMDKVVKTPEKYQKLGDEGRQWAKEEFADEKTGRFIEEFLDGLDEIDYDFKFKKEKRDPDYPLPDIQDNVEWLQDIYKNILKMDEEPESEGVKDWLKSLENGVPREEIYKYFVETAKKENERDYPKYLKDFILDTDNKKLCYMIPESIGDCYISLNVLEALRKVYPDYEFYVCTKEEYFQIFKPLTWVNLIPYMPSFEHFQVWEGNATDKGVVDIWFAPFYSTQRFPCYTHNGEDKNELQCLQVKGISDESEMSLGK